ncbi:MAG: hypothetical protein Q4G68_11155 [Planctomycetia bacterium]|nr:hypothetical protein [Planctomycetia bacterium]
MVRTLLLLLLGFVLCWLTNLPWKRAEAQSPGVPGRVVGAGPNLAPVSGRPELDQSALVAGNRTVPITRPLEVPPLYAFDSMVAPDCQQVVIVDSETKRICVYHIRPSGNDATIRIVASRNFQWDLKLDDFNGDRDGLSPSQIRDQVLRNEQ